MKQSVPIVMSYIRGRKVLHFFTYKNNKVVLDNSESTYLYVWLAHEEHLEDRSDHKPKGNIIAFEDPVWEVDAVVLISIIPSHIPWIGTIQCNGDKHRHKLSRFISNGKYIIRSTVPIPKYETSMSANQAGSMIYQ